MYPEHEAKAFAKLDRTKAAKKIMESAEHKKLMLYVQHANHAHQEEELDEAEMMI